MIYMSGVVFSFEFTRYGSNLLDVDLTSRQSQSSDLRTPPPPPPLPFFSVLSPLSHCPPSPLPSTHPAKTLLLLLLLLLPSLFLPESGAARGSILIEVSWGQTIHSCFTIKKKKKKPQTQEGDQREEEKKKDTKQDGKGRQVRWSWSGGFVRA